MSRRDIQYDPNLPDESQGTLVLAVTIIFTALITISTGMRLAAKLWFGVRRGLEDLFIAIALVFNLTCNATEFEMVRIGFGRHLQFLSDQHWTLKRYSQYTVLFADISLWAVKVSICFFLLSIVGDVHRRAKWVIWGLITETTLTCTLQAIFWGLQARPLEKLWNPDVPGELASTQPLVATIITFTSINCVTDLFYALAPIYFFRELNTSPKKKIILLALTGSGLLVFATSVIRTAYVKEFFNPDFTWALPKLYVCTVVERNFAEVIADLPVVFSLARSMRKKAVTYLSRGTRGTTRGATGNGTYSILSDFNSVVRPDATVKSTSRKFGDFDAYGKGAQFTNLDLECADDEYPVREGSHVPPSHGMITVQTEIHLQSLDADSDSGESHQKVDRMLGWPTGMSFPEA